MPDPSLLVPTFVALADSLVDDFDLADLLGLLTERCVRIFEVSEAGLMLADSDGSLRVMTSSSETVRMLELFEVQAHEGPCLDAYMTCEPAGSLALAQSMERWPRFAPLAMSHGFSAVQSVPMRYRGTAIGGLNLFSRGEAGLHEDDLLAVQAMADVATIAILQHRERANTNLRNKQLAEALETRIVIEQAKGVLAERSKTLDVDSAFAALRDHARRNQLRLTDVAQGVVEGRIEIDTVRS